MNDAYEHIHKWGNNMTWTVEFLPQKAQMRTSWPAYSQQHFAWWIVFLISLSSRQTAVMQCPRQRNSWTKLSSSFPSLTLVEYHSLVGPAYILFSLCCIQCLEVQNMRDIPPTVSKEQLPWVQVTPYHPHSSVKLLRHLPHSTQHHAWRWWFRLSVYTLYNNDNNCRPCLIPFEQRNVIDNEIPHRTINSSSLYQKLNNFTICNGTFLSNSFFLLVSND